MQIQWQTMQTLIRLLRSSLIWHYTVCPDLYVQILRIIMVHYTVRSDKYHKFPKYLDTQKICCNHSKIWNMWLYNSVMSPNDADGMANSVDPDQTAPLGWLYKKTFTVRTAFALQGKLVIFTCPGTSVGRESASGNRSRVRSQAATYQSH